MAFYTYKCDICENVYNERRNMSKMTQLNFCPRCGGKLVQDIYPSALSFRGSGFYCTDYRTNNLTTSEK